MKIIQPNQPRPAPKKRPTATLGDLVSNPQDYQDGVWCWAGTLRRVLAGDDLGYVQLLIVGAAAIEIYRGKLNYDPVWYSKTGCLYTLLTDTPIFGIDLEQARAFGEVDNG